jgi:hypothetical protein
MQSMGYCDGRFRKLININGKIGANNHVRGKNLQTKPRQKFEAV